MSSRSSPPLFFTPLALPASPASPAPASSAVAGSTSSRAGSRAVAAATPDLRPDLPGGCTVSRLTRVAARRTEKPPAAQVRILASVTDPSPRSGVRPTSDDAVRSGLKAPAVAALVLAALAPGRVAVAGGLWADV